MPSKMTGDPKYYAIVLEGPRHGLPKKVYTSPAEAWQKIHDRQYWLSTHGQHEAQGVIAKKAMVFGYRTRKEAEQADVADEHGRSIQRIC